MNDRTHNGNLPPLSRLNVIICYHWYNYEIRTFEFHLYPALMNHFNFINNYFNVYMFTHTYLWYSLYCLFEMWHLVQWHYIYVWCIIMFTQFFCHIYSWFLSYMLPVMFIISKRIINRNVYHHKNIIMHTVHSNVSWSDTKQWQMNNISPLMMIMKWSTCTIAIIRGKISHLIIHICVCLRKSSSVEYFWIVKQYIRKPCMCGD